ncbi:hypothetical protein NSS79_10605 [Paenibacillus sp. FSL L8-0436]|uniref:hypothetical protein n=1 Tax=Paenibacillus sp. FSL L8-0436 TaxID=2954686 RepID=UPI003157FCA0
MTNISESIISILNGDEKARRVLEAFNGAVASQGLSEVEAAQARQALMMMLIANNPQAMSVMALESYAELH